VQELRCTLKSPQPFVPCSSTKEQVSSQFPLLHLWVLPIIKRIPHKIQSTAWSRPANASKSQQDFRFLCNPTNLVTHLLKHRHGALCLSCHARPHFLLHHQRPLPKSYTFPSSTLEATGRFPRSILEQVLLLLACLMVAALPPSVGALDKARCTTFE